MLNINLGMDRHIQNPQAIRNGIRMSRAEVYAMNNVLDHDAIRRQSLFAPKDVFEFFIVAQSNWADRKLVAVGITPEALIGLGDGIIPLFQESQADGLPYTDLPEGGIFEIGQIIYLANAKIQGKHNNVQVGIQDVLAHFPRTNDGLLLPMMGLYARKLAAIHRNGCRVEGAVDEIYHLGFVAEPDFDKADSEVPKPNMSPEIWTPTTPECNENFLINKYNAKNVDYTQGRCGDLFLLAMQTNTLGIIPLSFWRYAGRSFPITLPCPQTGHTPLYNLNRSKESPVYLTEFPEVSDANTDCDVPIISWFGGEMNLKYADFSPLNGRQVIYLLLSAIDDETGERAYRVMLKAFSRAYQCGNRNYDCLDWDTQKTIPYEKLLAQAVERGYLKIEGLSMDFKKLMDSALPWATRKPGVPLLGRVFQSGRIHLIVAARGVGKTEMLLLYSVMAVHAASFDNAFFENRLGRPIRVLYIQREMNLEADFEDRIKDAEKLLRRIAPGAVEATSNNGIDFYEPETSLVEADEQCKVLKKLAELDPEGTSQWILVIDSLQTEMPEVLNGGNIFREQMFPWLDFLRKKGVAIALLHHENQDGGISGPGSIQDLADLIFHLVPTDNKKVNGEADVEIVQEKRRPLKGKQQATAHWNWVTDEKLGITKFLSEYLDDDGEGTTEPPEPAEQGPQAPDASMPPLANESQQAPNLRLPEKLAELQAMSPDKMRVALFELWDKHGTHEDIAAALGCSKSSVAPLMRDCNVNKETFLEYLRKRNGYN